MEITRTMEFSSDLCHSGSRESPTPSSGYFLRHQIHNWNRHTQQLAKSPHWETKELFGYFTEGESSCGSSENVVPKSQICSTFSINSEHLSLEMCVRARTRTHAILG